MLCGNFSYVYINQFFGAVSDLPVKFIYLDNILILDDPAPVDQLSYIMTRHIELANRKPLL